MPFIYLNDEQTEIERKKFPPTESFPKCLRQPMGGES